jgi:hypothetical protein
MALLEELHAAASGYADEIVDGVATRVAATPVA